MINEIKKELSSKSNQEQAKILSRFFKTGKGEYGEGDEFLGIKVPETRKIAEKYSNADLDEIQILLESKIHEERLCALLILVKQYENKKTSDEEHKKIFEFYLKNAEKVNNWDLVDLTAPKIAGTYLFEHKELIHLLEELAESKNIWKQRISILATHYFIKKKKYEQTLKIAEKFLEHENDLIHKATGWMLRETGKQNLRIEEEFLKKNYKKMPRTMLRYAI